MSTNNNLLKNRVVIGHEISGGHVYIETPVVVVELSTTDYHTNLVGCQGGRRHHICDVPSLGP